MQQVKTYSLWFWHWMLGIWQSFNENQCLLRASALTFATALSIVPLLAVAFSISKGFGFQNTPYIRDFLLSISAGREEIVENIITYIDQTNVGTLGVVGIAFLLFTVFTLLSSIEQSFNTIWAVSQERTLARKFSDYLSVVLVCPLLVIAAFSFSASLQSTTLVQMILAYSVFSYIYLAFLNYLPILLVILALFFIYKLVPNDRISNKGCLLGAVIAGILWHLGQKTFISYQVGVTKYNAIYGSFAQLPLFLIWLYISWVIVLLGAEIGASLEKSRRSPIKGNSLEEFGLELKEKLALGIMLLVVKDFEAGKGPVRAKELAQRLDLPLVLVQKVLDVHCSLGYLVHVGQEKDLVYSAAVSPENISCLKLLQDFRAYTENEKLASRTLGLTPVHEYLQGLYFIMQDADSDCTLAHLASKI